MNLPSFEIIPGSAESSVILHVPHSSRFIPSEVLTDFLISGEQLEKELDEITDTLTDQVAVRAVEKLDQNFPRPWLFINRASRFVIDPERFPDERELMNRVGMGAVYTKTASGAQLRKSDFEKGALLERYFHPYSLALADLVADSLVRTERAAIIDVHSYRANQHPNAVNHGQRRPEMCIGTDAFHTPQWLRDIFYEVFGSIGECFENEPYAGTYVPLDFYQKDARVFSIMMETRADTFLDADLKPHEGFDAITDALSRVISRVHDAGRL
ncbi:MAG: N-formylglutamate amidohydrolase [Candidatus Nanopelagicaceae bacterium]|nr:N-formylglutamate amidohydrolase [Candidatus Nanopelagicaceae bacterium]